MCWRLDAVHMLPSQDGVLKQGPSRPHFRKVSRETGWWWLEPWNFTFFHILGIIIPTDELIFFRGVGIPPTRRTWELDYNISTGGFRHRGQQLGSCTCCIFDSGHSAGWPSWWFGVWICLNRTWEAVLPQCSSLPGLCRSFTTVATGGTPSRTQRAFAHQEDPGMCGLRMVGLELLLSRPPRAVNMHSWPAHIPLLMLDRFCPSCYDWAWFCQMFPPSFLCIRTRTGAPHFKQSTVATQPRISLSRSGRIPQNQVLFRLIFTEFLTPPNLECCAEKHDLNISRKLAVASWSLLLLQQGRGSSESNTVIIYIYIWLYMYIRIYIYAWTLAFVYPPGP